VSNPNSKTIKLVIFDWDGTISDSVARIVSSMQRAAVELDMAVPSYLEVQEIIGLGLTEAAFRLFPQATREQVFQLQTSYSQHYRAEDSAPCAFFPGVEETLQQLKAEGYQLAVATGKSRAGLDRVLLNLGMEDFFHNSRCADETLSKPHPLMLEELLTEFDLSAEAAVMVGDTEFDMEMAVNAGMPRIAVSYGAHHADRLHAFDPLACVDLFSEIKSSLY
jgi:phosphoglycolate phosphatase|tara:strand:- start:782 stop:1444 length:663 start_codon:yes stop_codon:yes gene_type:complete